MDSALERSQGGLGLIGVRDAAPSAEGESCTTVELKVNFLRAVREATLGYVECEVKDEQGRLAAKAASTCLKLSRG